MRRLLIVGAGGLGRMVLSWALDIPASDRDWEIGGFLDDNSSALDSYNCGYSILRSITDYVYSPDDLLIMAIGMPQPKMRVADILIQKGAIFTQLIHPTAILANNVKLGVGVLVGPYAVICSDTFIDDFCMVNVHASIGHDVKIGAGCTISSHCDVTGYAQLGKGVFLGSHAVILPETVVEDFAIIGAGSVAVKNVKKGESVLGVPARLIS